MVVCWIEWLCCGDGSVWLIASSFFLWMLVYLNQPKGKDAVRFLGKTNVDPNLREPTPPTLAEVTPLLANGFYFYFWAGFRDPVFWKKSETKGGRFQQFGISCTEGSGGEYLDFGITCGNGWRYFHLLRSLAGSLLKVAGAPQVDRRDAIVRDWVFRNFWRIVSDFGLCCCKHLVLIFNSTRNHQWYSKQPLNYVSFPPLILSMNKKYLLIWQFCE